MASHLFRRGGLWWVRPVVPARHREAIGKREFIRSTRSHELPTAKLACSVLVSEWRKQLLTLDGLSMTSDVLKLIGPAVGLVATSHVRLSDAVTSGGISKVQLLRIAATGKLQLFCRVPRLSGYVIPVDELEFDNPALGVPGGFVVPTVALMPENAVEAVFSGLLAVPVNECALIADAIQAENLDTVNILAFDAPGTTGKLFIPNECYRVEVESLEILSAAVLTIRKHLIKAITPDQFSQAKDIQRASIQGVSVNLGKKANKRFSEALNAFASEELPHSNKYPKEIERIKTGIKLFIDLVGDLKLSEIDADILRGYRDGPLSTVPAKLNHAESRFKTTGQGIKTTIAAIKESGINWPSLSPAEVDQRMTWICRMFRWLQGEWLTNDPSLPLHGKSILNKAQKKAALQVKKKRVPFTQGELDSIFSQSWFKTGNGLAAEVEGINRKWLPLEYWLPLLGLHAGERIKELSQLHLTDVKVTDKGIWYLDINESTPDKSLKNGDSPRKTPIHQIVLDAGFIEWCACLKAEGYQRVFPDVIWEPVTGYAKEPKRRMSSMLEGLGMIRDGTRVFHSFRHNANNAFIRLALENLVPEKMRLRIMGHSPGSDVNNTHYFQDFEPDETTKYVQLLNYGLPDIAKFDINAGIVAIHEALKRKQGRRKGREDMGPLNPARAPKP